MKILAPLALVAALLPAADELLAPKTRAKLLAATDEVAKLGDAELVDELAAVIERAGEAPDAIAERRNKRWTRTLERAKTPPKDSARRAAAKKVEAAVAAAIEDLGSAQDPYTADGIAELLTALDSNCAPAHDLLGHELVNGRYLDEVAAKMELRGREIEERIREVEGLEINFEHASPSPSKFLTKFLGDATHSVAAHGVRLHGGVAADRLERALDRALRALAFSEWVRTGKLEIPTFKPVIDLYYADDIDQYEDAIAFAKEEKFLRPGTYEYDNAKTLAGFPAERDVYVVNWVPLSKISADIVWFAESRMLPEDTPAFLFAGHTNWLCLRFLGTTKPASIALDTAKADRTVASGMNDDDAMWRAAQSGLFGARSYLVRILENGGDPSLNDAVVDHEGKVAGVPMLVATVAVDYLQLTDRFPDVANSKPEKDEGLVAFIERTLGETIPEFDDRWQAFLLAGGAQAGILQRALGQGTKAKNDAPDPAAEKALAHLKKIRETAFDPLETFTEELGLYPELSANAAKHAAYLQLNPDQKQAWPDAHEEYSDREGFSPEGAWAGGHGVIAFDGDSVAAIDAWMATFYHRLPLLEPGLCGIGVAVDRDVVVLDSGSLLNSYTGEAHVRWPAPLASDVPLAWRPELPNPVPDEDQSGWGYPITVQSYWGVEGKVGTLELALFVDESDEPVECHFVSPTSTKQKRIKPADAYCLIPKERLEPNTRYRVEATVVERGTSFKWTFKTGRNTY